MDPSSPHCGVTLWELRVASAGGHQQENRLSKSGRGDGRDRLVRDEGACGINGVDISSGRN